PVTAAGVRGGIFRAGYQGASGWAQDQHVVHYARARRAFRDVRDTDLIDGALNQLRWIDVDGLPVAVRTSAIWAEGESHYEPHVYEYRAYCWNEDRGAFVRAYSARSAGRFDDRGPPDRDFTGLLNALRNAVGAACGAA